ncbi:MAG: hypothetical protein HQM09_22010, partial [Candidatus Riflebacteria bacterium]|nr:hypothetical protein [Candidatus Riflebacteria bacterium]
MLLIVPAHGADFDILGAVRLLQLRLRQSHPLILHPTRLAHNAWEFARRRKWLRTILPQKLRWGDITDAHLVGVTQAHHHPEVCERLTRDERTVFSYGHASPRLPFRANHVSVHSMSITAHLFMEDIAAGRVFDPDDIALFTLAVTEKTWAGLSSRASKTDFEALEELRRRNVASQNTSNANVGNTIVVGLREGQRGLLNDLLSEGSDVEINDWPVLISVVRSIGQVQDLDPVIDALWSRQDPAILIVGICSGGLTRVWARARPHGIDLRRVFADRHPREQDGWTMFFLTENVPEQVRAMLTEELAGELPPDFPAAAIMTAAPKTVPSSTSVAEAQDLMLKFHLMGLVVVDADGERGENGKDNGDIVCS